MSDPLRAGTRRIMDEFELDEISFVDVPAQTGARAVIAKRADPADVAKRGGLADLITGAVDGHQHGICIERHLDGLVLYVMHASSVEGQEYGHDHVIVVDDDGSYVMSENHGHSHPIDSERLRALLRERATQGLPEGVLPSAAINPSEDPMDPELQKAREQIDALEARLASAEVIAKMSDAEKAYMDGLDSDEEREAFAAKSPEERAKMIEAQKRAATDADPVVYTADDGTQVRKSAGDLAIRLAKQSDDQARELAKMRAEKADAALAKRAETELAHLPGSLDVRKAVIAAVDGIADDTARKGALALLKAADAQQAEAFGTRGTTSASSVDKSASRAEAEADLERLAQERMQKAGESFADAYVHVSTAHPALAKRAIG